MVLPDTEAAKLSGPLAKEKVCSRSVVPGALQQHLFYGEYSPFKYAPIFESDFIQVTKKGEVLSIHKDIAVVTVGVMSTSPSFFLPNVMLLARPVNSPREMACNCRISTDRCPMELTRLFPLCFVNISIHDVYNRQLRLKLASGRAFYLQLYVHPECENEVFERWMRLVTLLHNSPEKVYGYEAVTPEIECVLEQTSVETLATELSDWQLEEPAMSPTMREYYEANRASSRKSGKSEGSEKPEDCSTRTRSRSRKSDPGKVEENAEETEDVPEFSQVQETWSPAKPPERRKKSRGPIGFNLFKKDKSSKEKTPEEDWVPGPGTTPAEDNEKGLKMEGEEKDDGKKLDEGKGGQKEKSKGKEGKEVKQRDKDKEKVEKQMERAQQLKEKEEKRQQEKDKKKGREDKGGTDKGSRQQAREERRQAREERRRKREEKRKEKEAKQREEEEKKQRDREERKQREMEEKKKKLQQKDKRKQSKTKGNEEEDMN